MTELEQISVGVLVFVVLFVVIFWPRIPPPIERELEAPPFLSSRLEPGDPGRIRTEIELRFQGYRRGEPIVLGQPMTIIDLSHRSRR